MKRLAILLLLSSSAMLSYAANTTAADATDPCLQKRADILRQIDQAKKNGNDRRVAGLNKALREQEANCTPASMRKEREQDIIKARQKVAERDRELQEAKNEGKDGDKIAKRQAKLKEAQDALMRAQKALAD